MSALHAVGMKLHDDTLQVHERQMDLLILEELACSPAFGRWFLGQTGHTGAGSLELLRLLRSDSTYDGEADFLVVHATTAGSRALLIDNKLGVASTCSHPERLRTRGQTGIAAGCWQKFATVLTAPRHYLAEVDEAVFDCKVPYEAIRQAIAAHGDPARIACKLKLLDCSMAKAIAI
jgi:hypothetical protein